MTVETVTDIALEGFFKGYEDLLKLIRPYQFGATLK